MERKDCIAMILAGERGAKLGALTDCMAKPAIFYGGDHRIIDFTLSNCYHSGIGAVGVLTHHLCDGLHSYIGDGRAWRLSGQGKGIFLLPSGHGGGDYKSAVDAVLRNLDFIEQSGSQYVCVLPGDQVYKMDYAKMLDFHKKNAAAATLASTALLPAGSEHELIRAGETGAVLSFEGKARETKGRLASMGIYIFNWCALRKYLTAGGDFGADVLPAMLSSREKVYAYRFDGYWRDVNTVESLWRSNMDLLRVPPEFVIEEKGKEVFSSFDSWPSHFFEKNARGGLPGGPRAVAGEVEHSVLSKSVVVEEGAEVVDSVLMPNVYVGKNVKIHKAIIGPNSYIMEGAEIGAETGIDAFVADQFCTNGISMIASWAYIARGIKLQKNSHVGNGVFVKNGSPIRAGGGPKRGAAGQSLSPKRRRTDRFITQRHRNPAGEPARAQGV